MDTAFHSSINGLVLLLEMLLGRGGSKGCEKKQVCTLTFENHILLNKVHQNCVSCLINRYGATPEMRKGRSPNCYPSQKILAPPFLSGSLKRSATHPKPKLASKIIFEKVNQLYQKPVVIELWSNISVFFLNMLHRSLL